MSWSARVSRRLFSGLLALAAALAVLPAASPVGQALPSPERPRLVVVLVIDQFRSDYIDRYGHTWTAGLRRLLDRGARFPQAAYPFYSTVTCAGHATIGTGTLPTTHGMILNTWFDRATGRQTACTADSGARLISYGRALDTGGESGARLMATTLADEMRAQLDPPARVLSFSLKARSAIGLAGHRGDAVVWFDDRGAFVTSSAFADGPVSAVATHIAAHPVEADLGRTWTRMLPVDRYLFASPATGAKPDAAMTDAFPHLLGGSGTGQADAAFYAQWKTSPFSDAYLAAMALAVVRELGAGSEGRTDFVGVSFSALDLVGHDFGPHSHEVQDVLARLDVTIGAFLDTLDRLVGRDHYVVALSADHGVAPVPEYAASLGLPAGRRSSASVREAVEEALRPLGEGRHVAASVYSDLYLTADAWALVRQRPDLIAAVKTRVLALDGVRAIYTRDEIAAGGFAEGSAGHRLSLGFFPDRSGDFLIALDPYWIASSDATTHGTGYAYDARVPLIFMGAAFAPGVHPDAASPADIAPTLAHLVGVTLPAPSGRVQATALAPRR